MKLNLAYIALLLIAFSACREDSGDSIEANFGYSYAPIEFNQERIYQVDSILYDDFNNSIDTISLQRREVVSRKLNDNQGRPIYRTSVYFRSNDTSEWRLDHTFDQRQNDVRYERKVGNQSLIHLVFPVRDDQRWNANALNAGPELNFIYSKLHQPKNLNSFSFDSTLTVIQRNESNLVEQIRTEEIYATGYGLVQRYDEELNLNFQNGAIRSGYRANISLISRNF